jgi:AcrR family transcriptional regulator
MSSDGRAQILDGALALLRDGGTVTLDSVARRSGLTKPGLMYHFPTKEALMLGVVDHSVDRWERDLTARLEGALSESAPAVRIRAYLDWCLSGQFDPSDLGMLADPRLSERTTAQWAARIGPWIALPPELSPARRGRLTAVRLLADGIWFAEATGLFPPAPDEREQLRAIAYQLLED